MSHICKRCRQTRRPPNDQYPQYCNRCGSAISLAGRVPDIEVVSLGSFAGGSFGTSGNSSTVYEVFAVTGPFNAGAFSAVPYTFIDKAEAEACASEEREKAAAAAAERQAALGHVPEGKEKR